MTIDLQIVKENLVKKKKDDPDTFGWSFDRCTGYKCVICGGSVSPAVVDYFDHDVERLKCYKCQENNY